MTAADISRLLAERHKDDIFVEQCKNGSTYTPVPGGLLQLDAWAMAKSWAHPMMTAYEIKVSRQDFLRDEKWRRALPLCNAFYWVAPQGIIDPTEIAPECGLLIASKSGSRLFTKKKAPSRDINPPYDLLRYILICRSRIDAEYKPKSRADEWREWMARNDENKDLGWNVSGKIRRLVQERIDKVSAENNELRQIIKSYEHATRILEKYGLLTGTRAGVKTPYMPRYIEDKVRRVVEVVPPGLPEKLRRMADELDQVAQAEELSSQLEDYRAAMETASNIEGESNEKVSPLSST